MSHQHVHQVQSLDDLQQLLNSTTYVMVDFYADWCPPCRMIAPVYDELAAKHRVEGVLAFASANVDKLQDVAQAYSVTAMPTFIFFKQGKKVAVNGDEMVRGADAQRLTAAAEKLAGLAQQ
ncbi:hypothetical protein CDD82_5873 [Ophiocordyceps australis]|uniref:Thioredoxin domain-containing protein n=1 Tax=Ophiocordyceps australis TaxID=1399860 RepID=A0A2C5Z0D9_9HYPO|nr:hypothetical protein CDD82_5873 [Ophiocordyceps australis]